MFTKKALFSSLLKFCFVVMVAHSTEAAIVFQDGFETGSLGPAWSVSTTADGRVTVTSDHGPASGLRHLVLDDSVNDSLFSVAESTLQLNLSNKKNVLLSFKAKSLGNEPHYPFVNESRTFDGVSISTDGGTTWQMVTWLGEVGTEWESFSILLDPLVDFVDEPLGADFRIRFSEYDNASAPLDGIALDDVVVTADVDQRALLELPDELIEGTGPYIGFVLLAFAPSNTLRLALIASPPGQINAPAFVDIPAGETFVSFSFSVVDDDLVNLTRTAEIRATANDVTSYTSYALILDNDAPLVSLTLPAQLVEGMFPNNNARISLDRAPAVPFELYLSALPWEEIYLPYSITIPAGQTEAVFTVYAYDDFRIDGNVSVTVMAGANSVVTATNRLTTIDNEMRALSLGLPASLQEGTMGIGTVRISGTLATNLPVQLTSLDLTALAVPASVTIVAGEIEAAFPMTAADNAIRDGSRNTSIMAAAGTFTSASQVVIIRDNEVASYRFGSLSSIVDVSKPMRITVSAADIEGNAIAGATRVVTLRVVLPDGTTLPVMPGTVTLSGAEGWTGGVTLPPVNSSPLRLRATDDLGNTGDSLPFDIMRVLNLPAADLAWDPIRNRLYASVPANADDTNANRVVVIDPVRGEITGSVVTGQDPGQLILTDGGEYLYVALNGNGSIARINPASMTVALTFAVGTSPFFGTLYAADMCAVAGQPNLIVVSQRRTSVSPEHDGVAVYDNGVARPSKTQDHTGSNVIEPSADPAIFFGYNTESTEYGFRRLRLDASGMTELEVDRNLIEGFYIDIRSAGDQVFSTSGVEVDGAQLRRLGVFPASGPVCPDLAAHRVYFIERRHPDFFFDEYDSIGAYDPTTFSAIRKLTLPTPVMDPEGFIRWGTKGLAFLTDSNVVLITSSQLVPSALPADLALTVAASPNPAALSTPVTFSLCVSNQGPNPATNVLLEATVSAGQTIQNITASQGMPMRSSNTITLFPGRLLAGECAILTIVTFPQSAGSFTCSASTSSDSIDPDFVNNTATDIVSVGFQSGINAVNKLQLAANNLVYDATRNLLWVSIPKTMDSLLGRSIVSIDPTTGEISDPISIPGDATSMCMALSPNGRYLYIGLTDSPEVLRVDLAGDFASVRIPLGPNQWSDAGYAEDIEPLDGDGTSFMVTTYGDNGAAVFDGFVRRPNRSGIYTVDRIERTATPDVFVGYANSISSYQLTRLSVTATGVAISQSVNGLVQGAREIRGAGNLVLSSTGFLVNSSNLTLRANLGVFGSPCLDLPHQRAYVVNGNVLRGFDTATSLATEHFALPVESTGDWSKTCIRWGLDGFAILGQEGEVYIFRWSSTIPAATDSDDDGLPDAWEAAYFSSLEADPAGDEDADLLANFEEYLFGTSPRQASANPVQVSANSGVGQMLIRLVFPRRAGLSPQPYELVISSDLKQWTPAADVSETVLSTQTVDGVEVETVEAVIPSPNLTKSFVRFRWLPQ